MKNLITQIQQYDKLKIDTLTNTQVSFLKKTVTELVKIGKPIVGELIEILRKKKFPSGIYAMKALAKIPDIRSIPDIIMMLGNDNFGKKAEEILKELGTKAVPHLIETLRNIITQPEKFKEENKFSDLSEDVLLILGAIRCPESSKFLRKLLKDYLSEMPDVSFDMGTHKWKFENINFFFLLESLVKQQDKATIPLIRKARDRFPSHYTDHIACRIAIGRIIRKAPDDGFLPMDVMDISMPAGAIFDAFDNAIKGENSGKSFDHDEFLQNNYGEYLLDNE